jgi:5-methyltetrahydropteroyltriglutamate--homocysteine methyltransferase
MLEYDDDRSGSFEPLKDVPEDKMVVLGLVQCGFSTSVVGNAITVEDEAYKLGVITETARVVWG